MLRKTDAILLEKRERWNFCNTSAYIIKWW